MSKDKKTRTAWDDINEFNRRFREERRLGSLGLSPTSASPPPPPQPLGFSPIKAIDIPPSPPQALGLSKITCLGITPEEPQEALSFNYYVLLSEEPTSEEVAPKTSTGTKTTPKRKRKVRQTEGTKKTSPPPPVEEQATPPAAPTTSAPATTPKTKPAPTSAPRPRHGTQTSPHHRPQPQHGIVIHGVALRKDLGRVRRWIETSNQDLGKTTGIRWLRKETTLREEGKKTSSVVIYLETPKEAGKVRLGGKWLRTEIYEPDRGRK